MKFLNTLLLIFIFSTILYSQEIIFEKEYNQLPFPLRIENSGIYSIASFDILNNDIYLSSFNSSTVYKYDGQNFINYSVVNNLKDFIASLSTIGMLTKKSASNQSENGNISYLKNYNYGFSILENNGGIISGNSGEEIKILVPNRNSLTIESNLKNSFTNLKIDFPGNLACADLIGIDKNSNYYIIVEKYISEIPLKVERVIYTISKNGIILSQLHLPRIKYLFTIKEFQIDEDGNLYHLLSLKDRIQIVEWKNLASEGNFKSYSYPAEYNYELDYNYLTPTTEAVAQSSPLNKSVLTKVNRTKVLQYSETFVLHQYECKSGNLAATQVNGPDGDAVRTPSWLVVGMNARIPYMWGGFNTLAQFDAGLKNGRFAGDIVTSGVSSYALGVDCSGYVSRCWQLSYHSSTSDMPGITTQYSSWDNLKPGDAIHKVGHVRLFIARNPNGSFKVVEASARNWDVSYWSYYSSDLSSYTPRYYNNMEDNFNSQQPELIIADKLSNNSVKLVWNCNTTDIFGYRIYYSTDGINWSLIQDETKCQTTNTEISLTSSINYFRVSSVKKDSPNFSESNWSNALGVNISSSSKNALIVDGFTRESESGSWQGAGHTFAIKYGNALLKKNISFISIKNSELQNNNFMLENYDYIFWILGDESTINETFNLAEQQLVTNYLQSGGNLFISGSEIGWDLDNKGSTSDKNFYYNYLKAKYISDDAGAVAVKGISNNIFKNVNMNIAQTYEEDYPDEIAPNNGSKTCMLYSNNKVAGIEYTGTFGNSTVKSSLIHLAFPLETTADDSSFNNVISTSLDYFNLDKVSVNNNEEINSEYYLNQNYPNPFNPSTEIKFHISNGNKVELLVYDILGNKVAELINEYKQAGSYSFTFNANKYGLTSGVYFYKIISGNFTQTKKIILIK